MTESAIAAETAKTVMVVVLYFVGQAKGCSPEPPKPSNLS